MSNIEECDTDLLEVEHDDDDIVEVCSTGRRAVSSGEPSLDGSVDVDEERGALSDSEISQVARTNTIAAQVKGPSSDALEESCRLEAVGRERPSEWEDILGSGKLMKRVIIPGSGHSHDRPKDGQWIVIKVIDTLRGLDSHNRLRFITGYSMVIDAWELVVKLMYVGETCAVRAKALLAYGDIGLDEIIHPEQDQEYTIELLEIEEEPDFGAMEEEPLKEFVLMVKERGNYYFTRKEYDKAIFVYRRATRIIDGQPESEDLRKLFSALHSNLAVCYAKLGDMNEVLKCTEESLLLHSGNPKALYHRSVALSSKSNYDEASECLNKALASEPNDIAIANEISRLSGLRKRHQNEEKVLYKKMLSGIGEKNGRQSWWPIVRRWRTAGIIFFIFMSCAFFYFLLKMLL